MTVYPRSLPPFSRRRREQQRILQEVSKRHPPTPQEAGRWLHLDFSKREDAAAARERVVAWLDEINADWSRYVKVYPRA